MRHFFAMPLLNAARNIVKMHAYFMRAYFNSLHFSDVVTCNAITRRGVEIPKLTGSFHTGSLN